VEKNFAAPRLKKNASRRAKTFHYKCVDEVKRGRRCSRFTCADLKRRYSTEELQSEVNTFSPTPYEESYALLEIKAFKRGWNMRSGDIRRAFLVGLNAGDAEGNPVHVRTFPEHYEH
jgi:hypothetical protein